MTYLIDPTVIRDVTKAQQDLARRIIPVNMLGSVEEEVPMARHVDQDTFRNVMKANDRAMCRFLSHRVVMDVTELQYNALYRDKLAQWLQDAPEDIGREIHKWFPRTDDIYVTELQLHPKMEAFEFSVFMWVEVAYTTDCLSEADAARNARPGHPVGALPKVQGAEDLP